jgi:nitrilase
MIVGPWGEILAQQAEGEGVVLAEMDLQRIREVQASLPANANRRMN